MDFVLNLSHFKSHCPNYSQYSVNIVNLGKEVFLVIAISTILLDLTNLNSAEKFTQLQIHEYGYS